MSDEKKTYLLEIPAEKQAKRGWTVELDGKTVPEVKSVVLRNPKFGQLTYGMHPGGYDVWGFHEIGGGGSVILPFVQVNRELYIGVVEQQRDTQGSKVWNAPRGFLKPGENHFLAAAREASEELGGDAQHEPFLLAGKPTNPNSAFFETWGKDEGVRYFGLPFALRDFDLTNPDKGLRLNATALKANPASQAAKLAEQILGSIFMHWSDAVQLEDMFTVSGAGRLLAHLRPNV